MPSDKARAIVDAMERDISALDLRMTVKLGSMIFVGFGATIAALRLWL